MINYFFHRPSEIIKTLSTFYSSVILHNFEVLLWFLHISERFWDWGSTSNRILRFTAFVIFMGFNLITFLVLDDVMSCFLYESIQFSICQNWIFGEPVPSSLWFLKLELKFIKLDHVNLSNLSQALQSCSMRSFREEIIMANDLTWGYCVNSQIWVDFLILNSNNFAAHFRMTAPISRSDMFPILLVCGFLFVFFLVDNTFSPSDFKNSFFDDINVRLLVSLHEYFVVDDIVSNSERVHDSPDLQLSVMLQEWQVVEEI